MKAKEVYLPKIVFFLLLLNIFMMKNNNIIMLSSGSINQTGGAFLVEYRSPVTVLIDGFVSPNEYPSHFRDQITGIDAYFAHNGTDLFIGLVSPSLGWLSIAFGPQGIGMDGSNIYIGFISGETLVWEDHYGIGLNHVADTGLEGGTTDIGEADGTENATHTIIEFHCPLSSGDQYDHNFVAGGTYGFLLAHHPTADDLTSYHPEKSDYLLLTIEASALLMPLQLDPQVILNGFISENEYEMEFYDPITNIEVFMQHNGTDMFIGLVSPSSGWLGIGFGPKGVGMNGSNIIIGYVKNSNELTISDSYGVPDFHFSDISDGGIDDIKDSAGTEAVSGTIMEFIFPLASGDLEHDHNFTIWETYGFFLSRSTVDDFITMHPVHSPTYDFSIIGEKVTTNVTITAFDEEGNTLISGSHVQQDSTIFLRAILSIADEDCDCLIGVSVNFYINSTFGKMKETVGFTDRNKSITFSYNLTNIKGVVRFIIELPETPVAWQLLSSSEAELMLEVTESYEEELRFIDDPELGKIIALGILSAVGVIVLTYIFVLFNIGRISPWRKR